MDEIKSNETMHHPNRESFCAYKVTIYIEANWIRSKNNLEMSFMAMVQGNEAMHDINGHWNFIRQ